MHVVLNVLCHDTDVCRVEEPPVIKLGVSTSTVVLPTTPIASEDDDQKLSSLLSEEGAKANDGKAGEAHDTAAAKGEQGDTSASGGNDNISKRGSTAGGKGADSDISGVGGHDDEIPEGVWPPIGKHRKNAPVLFYQQDQSAFGLPAGGFACVKISL